MDARHLITKDYLLGLSPIRQCGVSSFLPLHVHAWGRCTICSGMVTCRPDRTSTLHNSLFKGGCAGRLDKHGGTLHMVRKLIFRYRAEILDCDLDIQGASCVFAMSQVNLPHLQPSRLMQACIFSLHACVLPTSCTGRPVPSPVK